VPNWSVSPPGSMAARRPSSVRPQPWVIDDHSGVPAADVHPGEPIPQTRYPASSGWVWGVRPTAQRRQRYVVWKQTGLVRRTGSCTKFDRPSPCPQQSRPGRACSQALPSLLMDRVDGFASEHTSAPLRERPPRLPARCREDGPVKAVSMCSQPSFVGKRAGGNCRPTCRA
jgi:hypothetical protein